MPVHTLKGFDGKDTGLHVSFPETMAFRSADEALGWLKVNVAGTIHMTRRLRTFGTSVELEVQGLGKV